MRVIQNSIQEEGEWNRLVNKKPPNLIKDEGGKLTFQRKAVLTKGPNSTGLE